MNKKALIILGVIFLLIVGTLGFLVYEKYANKTTSSASVATTTGSTAGTPTPTPTTVPTAAGNQPVQLTTDQAVSPVLFYDGQGVAYFTPAGALTQTEFAPSSSLPTVQQTVTVGIPTLQNFTSILWPSSGNDFIAQDAGTASTSWYYFNSQANQYTQLSPQIQSVDWLPGGKQIMYIWVQNNQATLNVSNPDGSSWKQVAQMWELDDSIHISPNGQSILYYETADTASTTNLINLTTPDGKVWKTLVKDGYNSGVLWSPDSQKFLFGKRDPATQKYQLWLYFMSSGQEKSLGVYTTPDKAVWSADSQTVYAAVPQSSTASLAGSLTQDNFVGLNVTSGANQSLSVPSQPIDGQNLFLSLDGKYLFFKNAQDGTLYYLSLSQ